MFDKMVITFVFIFFMTVVVMIGTCLHTDLGSKIESKMIKKCVEKESYSQCIKIIRGQNEKGEK